jgi:hypothetical protein
MANETIHVSLREHNPYDTESPKILSEVLDAIDPSTNHVVFLVENATPDSRFLYALSSANSGEVSYYGAISESLMLLPDSHTLEELPLLKRLSTKTFSQQILLLNELYNSSNGDGKFDWEELEFQIGNNPSYISQKFLLERAQEFDKLRRALEAQGKTLEVITEPAGGLESASQKFLSKIAPIQKKVMKSLESGDLDNAIKSMTDLNLRVILLGMARDEQTALSLLDSLEINQKGKTEVFTHFGTLHKYLPDLLEKYGFNVDLYEQGLLPHQEGFYEEAHRVVIESGMTFKELLGHEELINSLTQSLIEKYKLEILVDTLIYTQLQAKRINPKYSIISKRFNEIMKSLEEIPREEAVKKVKGMFETS